MLLQLHAKNQKKFTLIFQISRKPHLHGLFWSRKKKSPKSPALSLFKLDDKRHAKNKKILTSGSREKTAEKRTNVQRVFYRTFTL